VIEHNLVQGSPEWLAYRRNHFNASDAPAMMGCSPYKTRTELLAELSTGVAPEIGADTQRILDNGHRYEALARPLAEEIIGEDLYPLVGSEGRLSASFDGLTMAWDAALEHKSLNDELRACMTADCTGDCLPMHYQIQMEQQCMVSGAQRVLFMASKWDGDTLVEERHCWYTPNPDLAARIRAGWAQFEQDLAAFVPTERAVAPVGKAVTSLPAVTVAVQGSIVVKDNFKAFEVALKDFLAHRLILKPETDQDFADLDLQIKAMKGAEAALESAEAQMLSQVEAVDQAKRTKDMLLKLTRDNRLMAEKQLAARKDQIRVEQVQRGTQALADHIAALNTRLGKPYMPATHADFAGAIKGKRTVDSLRDAVDTLLAQTKIAASATADRIQINLATLRELAGAHAFLFADAAQIVLKAPDDLTLLVKSRISDHEAAEAARLEQERERIRLEEAARAERLAREDLEARRRAVAAIGWPEPSTPPAAAPAPVETPAPAPATVSPPSLVAANNAARAAIAETTQTMRTRPAAEVNWIKTADVAAALGLPVNAELLASLGYPGTKRTGPGMWWDDAKVEHIAFAVQSHVRTSLAAYRARTTCTA
jgi:putative phage-type endonuclease